MILNWLCVCVRGRMCVCVLALDCVSLSSSVSWDALTVWMARWLSFTTADILKKLMQILINAAAISSLLGS